MLESFDPSSFRMELYYDDDYEELKSLIGDALQLTRQNRRASQDFTQSMLETKVRRKSVMKQVIARKIPKLSEFIRNPDDKPIVRFKRMARVVLVLIQVCNVCKEIMTQGVRKEPWYALLDNVVATSNIKQKRKGPRAFVTFVPNEKRELIQLTFDVSEFKRDKRTEFLVTDEVRSILSILPKSRPPDQMPKVIRCMKGLFESFNHYPLAVQKQICQLSFYDKYRPNRVIVKKGQNPDGIYFVLSGSLIEKHDVGRLPKEIQTGSMFGENDLICGSRRRHTVLTRTVTELLFLHRQDYRLIFNMVENANDPRNLEICKQHIVFQHFPMQRLTDNPGTWSILRYKYGRLIAKDSNDLDWVYVIKSGEARVYKYLKPGDIDIQARRKKVQAMVNAQSSFYKRKKILNFVEEREYIRSSYSPRKYHPSVRPTMSAPAGAVRSRNINSNSRNVFTCIPGMRSQKNIFNSMNNNSKKQSRSATTRKKSDTTSGTTDTQKSSIHDDGIKLPKLILDDHSGDDEHDDDGENDKQNENRDQDAESNAQITETIRDLGQMSASESQRKNSQELTPGKSAKSLTVDKLPGTSEPESGRSTLRRPSVSQIKGRARSGSFLKTPISGTPPSSLSQKGSQGQIIQVGNHTLPAFVQIETLHPGQVFGLRACLDPEERGPSVSLVSGECEVLQINKKFFMKHCDDAIHSLIRLKAKQFPSQEDLIDRLDVNMQWEEYKQKTMSDFLQQCRQSER